MRLKKISVRNYRVHRDLTVELNDDFTLIGGPNECGKSTLIEAAHRALFLKSKVTGDVQKQMVSSRFGGSPEVEVGFTVADAEYIVTKRFSGVSGTTQLTLVGGATWHGDDAEARLALLLKVEEVGGGRGVGGRVAQQWSHLWVWQGQSGADPSEHATLQKDALLRQLQQKGGSAALQSDLDTVLAAKFAAAKEAIFTLAGKPKAGSDLERAENETAQAEANRQRAAAVVEKLREAALVFEDATKDIARAAENLRTLRLEQTVTDEKLGRVEELRRLETTRLPEATAAAAKYKALRDFDAQISALRGQIQNLQTSLQPENQQTTTLEERFANAKKHSGEAAQAYDFAANQARDSRLRRDLAAAWVGRFEKEARLQELTIKDGLARGHQAGVARLREELAGLPEVTGPKLKKLQKIEVEINQAETALKSIAAGIEVVSATEPVRVGLSDLAAGQTQVVTEETDIVFGNLLHLRISPGGGASLQEARNLAQESKRDLLKQLDELGVSDVVKAADALGRRNDLAGKIGNLEAALDGLDAANLPAALADAREAAAATVAEVETRSPQVADFKPPTRLAEARTRLAEENLSVEESEEGEKRATRMRDTEAKAFAAAEKTLSDHVSAISQRKNQLIGLKAQLHLLVETHGEDEPRARGLTGALTAKESAESLLATTRQALADLQPALLSMDQARLKRAREAAETAKREAENRRLEASVALRSDGTDDPEAALALAEGRARSASDHLASARRKAGAIHLLNELFQAEQRALAEQFTKPLVERISAYLECLFGGGARAGVTLAEDGFTGLQLFRPAQGAGAISFDSLSGGAREQVAAAVRLAMAEVLASDHDGCLPLVFDDAFAYSDPDRVQILQRMLDLAASRGLQLIILTCNPSDYAALGAREISLRPQRLDPTAQASVSATNLAEPNRETVDGEVADDHHAPKTIAHTAEVTEDQRLQLISRLRELGSKSGNQSLREELGWDETTYNAVKEDLVNSGRLVSGRGRGGSVALPAA